ncbi:MAG: gliding-motility protein MglA [Nitrospirae bacterium]|nr:gliding-motility protein MglA [Nitrospirota bacterium]
MPLIQYSTHEIECKVIYYGPGLCGKTENVRYIYNNTNPESRGQFASITTEKERTLFFDFLLLYLGNLSGFTLKVNLYTIPAKTFYEESKRLIINGMDGVIFVADSQVARMDANIESMENLKKDLSLLDTDLNYTPFVLQYNKRDLPGIMPVDEMNRLLNPAGIPAYESVAQKGEGVFESLRGVTDQVIVKLHNYLLT